MQLSVSALGGRKIHRLNLRQSMKWQRRLEAWLRLEIPVRKKCRPWSVLASGNSEAAAPYSAQSPHETFRRRRPLARSGALEAIKTSSPKKLRRRPWFVLARSKIQAAASAAAR